jgi:putative flippase GtrA
MQNGVVGRDLALYLVFGGAAAAANLSAGWLLYGVAIVPWLPYWCATGLAAAFGLVTNFGLNYSYNFRFRGRSAVRQFGTFCAVSGLGIVLTSAIATALRALLQRFAGAELHVAGIGADTDFVAHVAAVGLVVLYSYPAHKLVTFNIGICARLHQLKAAASR